MDRESDHEEMENREHGENGAESEDDSDMDQQHNLFMKKLQHELSQKRREDDGSESTVDEIRRMYEANSNNNNNNNNGHGPHIPMAHRPSSRTSLPSPFTSYSPHAANDRIFQYTLCNYLQSNPTIQQQYTAAGLSNLSTLQSSMLQPSTSSFQSLPPSRIPSPHHQFQQRQSSPPSYNRSPPNFPSPPPAHGKRSASVSSRQSREESTSPIHQNAWSFEEQFKQLYDIDRDDPKRKEFLDDLFTFMQKHETPVTRLPIMAKSVLDLYELYKLVVQRGGLVDVINKKLWQEVIKGLNLPSSITSAAFTLRTQYMKFLYRYECHKLGLSTPVELTTAIEGNKREGRRSSYYGDLGQMQSPSSSNGPSNNSHQPGSSLHHSQSQVSPVSVATTSTTNAGSNRLQVNGHSNQFGSLSGNASIPNAHGLSSLVLQGAPVPIQPDQRILEYIKLVNTRMMNNPPINGAGSSPELPEASTLSSLDMTQLALWNIYNGALKPPMQQNPVLPFQPARPPSQNSAAEGPLDLKSSRKEESPTLKRPAPENDEEDQNETEETDSDSDEEDGDCSMPTKNSSQGSEDSAKLSPVVVRMKINGTKYRGVLHPTSKI